MDKSSYSNLDTLGKRCIWARKRLLPPPGKKEVSQTIIAKEIGIEQQTYSSIEKGDTVSPRLIAKLAKVLQVKPGWLMFGEGTPHLYKIPSISWRDVLDWPTWMEVTRDNIKETVPMETDKYHGCYALTISNDLMVSSDPKEKSFAPGDIAIVNPELEPQNGDFVIAHEKGAPEAMLKKYVIDGIEKRLYSSKKDTRVIIVDDKIKFYGVVVAKRPPLETIREF